MDLLQGLLKLDEKKKINRQQLPQRYIREYLQPGFYRDLLERQQRTIHRTVRQTQGINHLL